MGGSSTHSEWRAKNGPQACLDARWAASVKMCSSFGIDIGHPLDLSDTGLPTIKKDLLSGPAR